MLETLDQHDWNQLRAERLPQFLRDLTTPNEELHEKAWSYIAETLIPWTALEGHQSPNMLSWLASREVIYITIPFLIELLTYQAISSSAKSYIIDILNDTARYVEADMFMPKEPKERKHEYRENAQSIYESVTSGIDIYTSLLNDVSESVVRHTSHILRVLTDLKDIILRWESEET